MLPFFAALQFAVLLFAASQQRLRRGALETLGALEGVIGSADAAIADKVE